MTDTEIQRLHKRVRSLESLVRARINVPEDPVAFCTDMLGFNPTEYQAQLLREPARFIAARWARQSGKSTTVSALLLWLCLRNPNYSVIVVAPSIRQSRLVVRKVASFLKLLPKALVPNPLKTRIEFYNGSRIQALPNSPETIRGEAAVNFVYIDECNFIMDDEELYDAVIFALGTTNGRFLATSTPGSTDALFYKLFHDDRIFGDVKRFHVTYLDALSPKGPLNPEFLAILERQFKGQPDRWEREMLAKWGQDSDRFFPMSLIERAIDPTLEYIPDELLLGTKKNPDDSEKAKNP